MVELTNKQWKVAIISSAVLLIVLGVVLWWAYSDGSKKEGELIGNIGVANGKNAVVANLVENKQVEVNNAANNSKQGETNFNISVNRDSSEFRGGDSTSAYCNRFPCDSTCIEWRQLNRPGIVCD